MSNAFEPELSHRFLTTFLVAGVLPDPLSLRFNRVSGLGYSMSLEQLNEGGNNASNRFLPRRSSFPNLVFERGVAVPTPTGVATQLMLSQFLTFLPSFDITVMLLNDSGLPTAVWMISDAIPVRMNYASLDAGSAQPLVSSMEFACRSIDWLGSKL